MKRIPTIARVAAILVVSTILPLALASPALAGKTKSIRINDASAVEGDSAHPNMVFTISWTGSKGGIAPSVHYATADGTATAGSDYTAVSATVSLKGSCRCATVSVPILDDKTTEPTETFTVNLSAATNGTIVDAHGVGTIYDNDGPPAFVVTDQSGLDDTGSLKFDVLLTHGISSTTTVDYATADGTALAGTDYTAASGTLSFGPNATDKTVTVSIVDHPIAEDNKTLTLTLSNATGGPTIERAQGTGTIISDAPDPTVSIASASVIEGDVGTTTLSLPVTLSGPSGQEVDVDYATSDAIATAGSDYIAASGTLVFAAGVTSKLIDVTVKGDFVDEGDETFTVTLSAPFDADLNPSASTATGTITNDDAGPKLSVTDVSVAEGNSGTTPMTFTVLMTPASGSDVSVDYVTADGTATAGSDYTATSGTLTIPAGQTSGSIVVAVTGDTTPEPAETLTLALSNPVGAKIVPPTTATGTITNDDKNPTAITMKVVKGRTVIKAKGTIQAATSGMKIKVSLLKKKGARYVLVTSKTVTAKGLKDRNLDGIPDAAYVAAFLRPGRGSYRFVATYAGDAAYASCTKSLSFKL